MTTKNNHDLSAAQKSFVSKLVRDPVLFASHVLGVSLWEREAEILRAIKTHRRTAVKASQAKGTPVVAAISSLSTRNAVQLAKDAEQAGCSGWMVLPPYVYTSDWREMKQHVAEIIRATKLPCTTNCTGCDGRTAGWAWCRCWRRTCGPTRPA